MKKCPYCGQDLDNNAVFCSRCGANLTSNVNNPGSIGPATGTGIAGDSGSAASNAASAFDDLYAQDAKFAGLFKIYKKKSLICLLNGLAIILPLFILFLPFFVLTGKNVADPSLLKSYPVDFSFVEIFKYMSLARSSKLNNVNFDFAPDGINTTIPSVILPILIVAVTIAIIGLLICIPSKKYAVLAYLRKDNNGNNGFSKGIKSYTSFLPGAISAVTSLVALFIISGILNDTTYSYINEKPYALGEVGFNNGTLTFAIVISFVVLALIVGGQILLNIFFISSKVDDLDVQ